MGKTKEVLFRSRDLPGMGISHGRLPMLLRRGEAERVARGLYRWVKQPPSEKFTMAAVCKVVPEAIVCLLSALRLHGIGTQDPHEIWIAVNRKAWKPRPRGLPIRVVRFSGAALTYGVEERVFDGVPVRVTNPARTVVDCFRYRNKIGLDVALEALEEAIRGRKTTRDAIARAAGMLRAANVIRPYLESFSR